MTLDEQDLIREVGELSVQRLHKWLHLGWVRPERREGTAVYHEVDVARVRLLYELEHIAEFDDETLPLILSLVDQIHGLRNELRSLAEAVGEQPTQVRERIRNAYARIADDDHHF
jgi:chaperone modulatory protein CbpM